MAGEVVNCTFYLASTFVGIAVLSFWKDNHLSAKKSGELFITLSRPAKFVNFAPLQTALLLCP
jgi:hypothetical protein